MCWGHKRVYPRGWEETERRGGSSYGHQCLRVRKAQSLSAALLNSVLVKLHMFVGSESRRVIVEV